MDDKKIKFSKNDNGIKFNVKVIPGSSKSQITEIIDGVIKIKLNSPPVEGKANIECIKLLSKVLQMPKTSISITSGDKSKLKTIQIEGADENIFSKIELL